MVTCVVGMRWRPPRPAARQFLNHSLTLSATSYGVLPERVYVTDGRGVRGVAAG